MRAFITRSIFSVLFLAANLGSAQADVYDDKARAAWQQQQQIENAKAYQKAFGLINQYNSAMLRRVPRDASDLRCYDRDASFYGSMRNGCRLGDSSWNGIPVQICLDGFRLSSEEQLPPEIVKCRYHLPDGRDCQMVRNPSIKPTCY
jgi:hypothetical protein